MSKSRDDSDRQYRLNNNDGSSPKLSKMPKENFRVPKQEVNAQFPPYNRHLFQPSDQNIHFSPKGLLNEPQSQNAAGSIQSLGQSHHFEPSLSDSHPCERLFKDDEFNTNSILSEIWGLPLEFSPPYVTKTKAQNITLGISPPLSPLSQSLEASMEKQKQTITLGPPPGFFAGSPTSSSPMQKDQAERQKSLDIYKKPSLDNISKETYAISKIFIPFSGLKPKIDYEAIISSIAKKKLKSFNDASKISVVIKSDSLIIDLLGASNGEIATSEKNYIENSKPVLQSWLHSVALGEMPTDSILLDVASARRELLFKLCVLTTSEVLLNTEALRRLEKLGMHYVKTLSEQTFVNIQMHSLQSKLVLFGDREGIDLVMFFLRLFSVENVQKMPEEKSTTFVLQKPVYSATILIPRCFHSPMIGIAGARLQSILKTFGNGSVRVSFPRYMSSPSWEVVISSSIYNICKESVANVKQALIESWKSIVTMSTRQRCSCVDSPYNSAELCASSEPASIPTGPGTPDCPGLLYSHLPHMEILKEKVTIKNRFPSVHHCDFARIVRQTGVKIDFLERERNEDGGKDGDKDGGKDGGHFQSTVPGYIEISGLPKSHLLQVELMLCWINSTRGGESS